MAVSKLLEHNGSHVHSVVPADPITKVVELFAVEKIGAAVVTDDQGKIAGIISERDVVRTLRGVGPGIMDQTVSRRRRLWSAHPAPAGRTSSS